MAYLDIVRELFKANGNTVPQKFKRQYHSISDVIEQRLLKSLLGIVKKQRVRFLRQFKASIFAELYKSESSDVHDEIQRILIASLGGASDELIAQLEPLIQQLSESFGSAYQVDLNFNLINQKAVEYLTDHAVNYFSTLADTQAKGIHDAIAAGMSSEKGYTINDVVKAVRAAFGKDVLYFPTSTGTREIPVAAWAMMTARTETSRAASFSQKATLESIDLKTWQWQAQDSCCDDCDDNDDEIVEIGDTFASGDTEPPVHPNCRCIVIAVQDELTSTKED